MIRMIAAVSRNGVIGQDNKLPFDYPEDLKFFRKMTANSTVIMGRKTFESIGRPLPKRRNIVISRNKVDVEGVETFQSLQSAYDNTKEFYALPDNMTQSYDVWLIGGSSIYQEGMQYTSEIYLTLIPETIEGDNVVRFPWINPLEFKVSDFISLENSKLKVVKYVRA